MIKQMEISSMRFVAKILAMLSISFAASFVILNSEFMALTIAAQFVLGLMFAHGVELLHECIHETAVADKKVNDMLGTLLGLPMLVSYHHYKWDHLQHHRTLGKPGDKGFFEYPVIREPNFMNLILSMFNPMRYGAVFGCIYRSIYKNPVAGIPSKIAESIRREYLFMGALIVLVFILTFVGVTWPLMIWALPLLVFAEPAHFLIEAPEHIFCDTSSSLVSKNSRSITGSVFSRWLTNGNNFHAEHHAYPQLPFNRLADIHLKEKNKLQHHAESYPAFYLQAVKETFTNKNQNAAEGNL